MSDWAEPTRCAICGHTDRRDLMYRLAHWRDAAPGMAYEHVSACSDRDACRARVAAQAKQWPLVDDNERKSA
jgi:hypothetical protein